MTNGQFSLLTLSVIGAIAASFCLGRLTHEADVALANLSTAPLVPEAKRETVYLGDGVILFVDPQNGCQYLRNGYTMTPRLHSDGVQMCDGSVEPEIQQESQELLPPASHRPDPDQDPLDADYAVLKAQANHPSWRF